MKEDILMMEGILTKSEIQTMKKRNPKGCIYHGLTKFLDCSFCNK